MRVIHVPTLHVIRGEIVTFMLALHKTRGADTEFIAPMSRMDTKKSEEHPTEFSAAVYHAIDDCKEHFKTRQHLIFDGAGVSDVALNRLVELAKKAGYRVFIET